MPFVGLYSTSILETSSGTASLAAGMVGIAYAILQSLGNRRPQDRSKKTIRFSLGVLIVLLLLIFFHDPLTSGMGSVPPIYVLGAAFFFGIFWVSIVTNSFPMLWQMSTYQTVGIYTGLYYFFSQLASIISPPLTGACIDIFGFRSIFVFGRFRWESHSSSCETSKAGNRRIGNQKR